MPTGIPVATVAINGGANAGILAAKILATSDDALLARLKEYSKNLKEQVEAKDKKLQEVGYKEYMKQQAQVSQHAFRAGEWRNHKVRTVKQRKKEKGREKKVL